METTEQTLVITRKSDGEPVAMTELTPLVAIASVEPKTTYSLSIWGDTEERISILIEDISSSKYYGYSSSIPLPYDRYRTLGLAQLVTLGPHNMLSLPRPHLEGARYIILVPYELEEPWLNELKNILQERQGSKAVFWLIPESVLRKLSEGPPTLKCTYFPSVYL